LQWSGGKSRRQGLGQTAGAGRNFGLRTSECGIRPQRAEEPRARRQRSEIRGQWSEVSRQSALSSWQQAVSCKTISEFRISSLELCYFSYELRIWNLVLRNSESRAGHCALRNCRCDCQVVQSKKVKPGTFLKSEELRVTRRPPLANVTAAIRKS
jgi:hypothetical protein